MSTRLNWKNCCSRIIEGKRCKRTATELGHMCTACWKSLPAEQRAALEWEAKWQIVTAAMNELAESPDPLAPLSLSDEFERFYADREAIRLQADLARFELGDAA